MLLRSLTDFDVLLSSYVALRICLDCALSIRCTESTWVGQNARFCLAPIFKCMNIKGHEGIGISGTFRAVTIADCPPWSSDPGTPTNSRWSSLFYCMPGVDRLDWGPAGAAKTRDATEKCTCARSCVGCQAGQYLTRWVRQSSISLNRWLRLRFSF